MGRWQTTLIPAPGEQRRDPWGKPARRANSGFSEEMRDPVLISRVERDQGRHLIPTLGLQTDRQTHRQNEYAYTYI